MAQPQANASDLYSKSQELEKQLRALLKKKNVFDKAAGAIRNNIRDLYVHLLFLDFDFATSKDVEQNLWKTVYYKVIEEYRKQIRKAVSSLQKNERSTMQEEVNKMCESFKAFLTQASKFYHDLIMKFQTTYSLKLDGSVAYHLNDTEKNASVHKAYLSCHRCYIFLGDLARYHRDLWTHCEESDWTCASIYYEKAISLVPDSGNPHNQLAVLATYVEDDLDAVYHYFRSLAVEHPFLTARENLAVLFEKNRAKLQAILEEKGNYGCEGMTKESERLARFKTLFARLHGMLFTRTNLETFESVQSTTLGQYTFLLRHRSIDWQLFLKLMVINIFSLHSIVTPTTENVFGLPISTSQQPALLKHAISLALELFSRTLASSNLPTDFYGSLSLFVDYLSLNPNFIVKPTDPRDQKTWQLTAKHLAAFLNAVSADDPKLFSEDSTPFAALSEERELFGFVPLQESYGAVDFSKVEDDERSRTKCLKKIVKFGVNTAASTRLLGANPLLYYDEKTHFFFDKNNQVAKEKGPRYVPKHSPEESKRDTVVTEILTNHTHALSKENTIKQILQNGYAAESKETLSSTMDKKILQRDIQLDDHMDEEVIVFQPVGDLAKLVQKEPVNQSTPKTAIGSGRSEKSPEEEKLDTIFEDKYNSFDLFKSHTYSPTSPYANNPPLAPRSEVNSTSLFSNFEPIQNRGTFSESLFFNVPPPPTRQSNGSAKPFSSMDQQNGHSTLGNGSYGVHPTSNHWSPMLSIGNSLFSLPPASSDIQDQWNTRTSNTGDIQRTNGFYQTPSFSGQTSQSPFGFGAFQYPPDRKSVV